MLCCLQNSAEIGGCKCLNENKSILTVGSQGLSEYLTMCMIQRNAKNKKKC